MNTISRSIVAASTALAVSLGGAVANAEPASEDYATRAFDNDAYQGGELLIEFFKNGQGAMPMTEGAMKMASGSITDLKMTGEQTYAASQAGWGLLWTALALIGVAGIYTAAQQAGLIK
ncbi:MULTISPECIES: hypothetical protein [Corynebacterium]|uniref:hypothetical protein n=1 Tax=Corynebacterium TaxID=1716 RepID=UPI0008A444D5|nr:MULTISPECIES: hypothetical protein [Corynebacterium]MCT1443295.1 hypothetical protein [Corynebacterium glucuronolyticum]MCT1563120.1 hypothetical protein [Corynebacterium glucuronolyticum]OFO42640.1 hypothetical protein HMPREF3044_05515 [Corynebacterium sp. HMSC073D01]